MNFLGGRLQASYCRQRSPARMAAPIPNRTPTEPASQSSAAGWRPAKKSAAPRGLRHRPLARPQASSIPSRDSSSQTGTPYRRRQSHAPNVRRHRYAPFPLPGGGSSTARRRSREHNTRQAGEARKLQMSFRRSSDFTQSNCTSRRAVTSLAGRAVGLAARTATAAAQLMPRVLNMRDLPDGVPDGAIYCGRPMPRRHLSGSPFANPFKLRRNATDTERTGWMNAG